MRSENIWYLSSENDSAEILKDLQMLQNKIQPIDVEEWLGEVDADSTLMKI